MIGPVKCPRRIELAHAGQPIAGSDVGIACGSFTAWRCDGILTTCRASALQGKVLAEEQPNLFGRLLAEAHFLAVASTEKRSLIPSVDSNPCLNASTG